MHNKIPIYPIFYLLKGGSLSTTSLYPKTRVIEIESRNLSFGFSEAEPGANPVSLAQHSGFRSLGLGV